MRPGDRIELRDLTVTHYSHRQRYLAQSLGGGDYTEHTFIMRDEYGRVYEYSGAKHLMRRVGDKVSMRANFANYKMILGKSGIRLIRPKLIGDEFAQLRLL